MSDGLAAYDSGKDAGLKQPETLHRWNGREIDVAYQPHQKFRYGIVRIFPRRDPGIDSNVQGEQGSKVIRRN